MHSLKFLDIGSQFLRMGREAGYLLLAADPVLGRIAHFDIVPRPDVFHWSRFFSSVGSSGDPRPAGLVYPGDPAMEEAIQTVMKGVTCQLSTRHFLSMLYQYLRTFQNGARGGNHVEMRFYRTVSRLLKAPALEEALRLLAAIQGDPEFKIGRLEEPLQWIEDRFPLLTAHYEVSGLPCDAWVAERAMSEVAILLTSVKAGLDRNSVTAVIKKRVPDIEGTLQDELGFGSPLATGHHLVLPVA